MIEESVTAGGVAWLLLLGEGLAGVDASGRGLMIRAMRGVGVVCAVSLVLICVGCGSDTSGEPSNSYYTPDTSESDYATEDSAESSGGGYGDFDQIRQMEYAACAGVMWSELKAESGYAGGGTNPSRADIEAAVEKLERTQGWATGPELRAAVEGCLDGYLHG